MKKLLSFAMLISLLIPITTFAIEGTCSSHRGVSCSAGPDWDGSAICLDGWRDSTEYYSSMLECRDEPTCSPEEYSQLKEKYNLDRLIKQRTDLGDTLNKLNLDRLATPARITEEARGQGIATGVVNAQISSALTAVDAQINSVLIKIYALQPSLEIAIDSVNHECNKLGVTRNTQAGSIQNVLVPQLVLPLPPKTPTLDPSKIYSNDEKCIALKLGFRFNQKTQNCEMTTDERCAIMGLGTWFNSNTQNCDTCPLGREKDPSSNSCISPKPKEVIVIKAVALTPAKPKEQPKPKVSEVIPVKIEAVATTTDATSSIQVFATTTISVPIPTPVPPITIHEPLPQPKTIWTKMISWFKFW